MNYIVRDLDYKWLLAIIFRDLCQIGLMNSIMEVKQPIFV